jgi:outer membrane lipoprotein
MKTTLWLIGSVLLLAGCATTVPLSIRTAPPGSPTLAVVRDNPDQYVGGKVRWGGIIAGVENRAKETWLEIVGRPLTNSGRPAPQGRSGGRFLARVGTFLDPAVYAQGKSVTVVGTLQQSVQRPIGQYPYRFPVVRTEMVYLWPPLPEPRPYIYDPFWRDPFWYDPWYPYHRPWPYHRHW